ncbi:MAG: hypothetical protein WBP71_16700 [Terracidiphilus sp.]
MGMKLMKDGWLRIAVLFAKCAKRMGHGSKIAVAQRCHPTLARNAISRQGWGTRAAVLLMMTAMAAIAPAQAVSTTTVQGTVYLANGQPGAGTLVVSWPAFTTAANQAIAADSTTVTIAADGFVSINLAPNLGATPAGEYYTAIFYMSDGTVNTQYWVVPAAAQASLAQVQAQLMPAAQAVQTVSKSYVDQSIAELEGSMLTASGGTMTGPLYLNGDPTQPMQAATKHYVDTQVGTAVPLAGGNMTGALTTPAVNGVEEPASGSSQTNLQAAMNAAGTNGAMEIPPNYAGTEAFTNTNGVKVTDWRTGGAQQTERSVKEFGAVCDGATDDTSALQAALNYANAHGVALTIPEGTCKTRALNWRGESIGGLSKQVSALMGFPGQDVLASTPDATNVLSYTRLHDLTIYVEQSTDVSCSPAGGRAAAGSCQMNRMMEKNSIFSPGANGLANTAGTGAGWWVGNCAIAMQANTGAGGNGLKVAEIENVEIATTGVDPMAAQYVGAHSTHTCGMYLAQWPQWSEFRNIDIRGLNTGVAIPALPVTAPAGLLADSNRWQNVTIQATHAFTAAAGSNNVLDNVVAMAGNSAATAEPPTGLALDLSGNAQGWTVRNAVVMPSWIAVQPSLTVTAAGGAVTAVNVGNEHGLGWDPYGTSVPVAFSGSCTAQATAAVNATGSIGSVTVTQGGVGCSATTTASLNAAGTWDTAAPVNLIGGQNMTFFAGNLLKGSGGYTAWNATGSASYGTQVDGGGGSLPGGGTYAALVGNGPVGAASQVDQFPGIDFGGKLQACISSVNATYGGTCDARNFTGSQSMGSNVTILTGNTTVLLPCATITTANQIIVTAGTRNVSLRGCALRGGSAASGSQGGTAFAYSGSAAMVQVGDPTYATDTSGFHMDDAVINTTAATTSTAQGLVAYRTQEMDVEEMYFLGNANQTGMTLDGTGNYTGGTFRGNQFSGFQTAVNAIGHQVVNPAITDWMNASTFVRLHIDCPTSNGNPISGTYGINLQQGDGNTFTGGDVEGCSTALHLGPNAQNNTIVGLRNENSTNQVVADAGSSYNNWMTGGTMFAGKLADSGTRNSFLDTFHRSFNGLNGDWYGSQRDATVTNSFRLGIGSGNERGLQDRYQTDYGYRWEVGLGDGTSGEQSYNFTDLLNNVPRITIGQYLSATPNVVTNVMVNNGGCYSSSTAPTIGISGGGGSGASATASMTTSTSLSCPGGYTVGSVAMTSEGGGYTSQPTLSFTGSNQTTAPNAVAEITTAGSTNNQTVINSAGTGAVVLNGLNNAGTGGVVFGSGGPSETTVATISNAGNVQFNGTLQVGGTSQSTGTMTVRNNSDAEVDYYLWPGLTTSQKGSYTYKDWNGNSQWYMVKDGSNNWALNSATGGLDSFKAYQSTNSGDTYIDASNASGHVRLNYETGSGAETDIYSGSSSNLDAAFLSPTSIKFPGLAASAGQFCLQIDNSGYVTNTGSACGTGSGGTTGVINSGNSGQIAYYTTNGTTVGGMSAVPVSSGGTGAATAATALANLGGMSASGGALTGSLTAPGFIGPLTGNVTGTASGNLVPANNLSDVASAATAVSNLLPGIASDGKQGVTAQGNVAAAAMVPTNSPFVDIRAFGAVMDNATDIGPAIQAAVNSFGYLPGHSPIILLPCTGANGAGGGCYWDNPSTLSVLNGYDYKVLLQGNLRVGSTLIAPYELQMYGNAAGAGVQYENGLPGAVTGPQVYGTVGTAITSTNTPVTITPTFTGGSPTNGNNLAHLPIGSALTIAGTASVSATAVRTAPGNGLGEVVYTLATYTRFVPDEIATVTGCADTSFNGANIAIDAVDYGAQTVTTWQSDVTPGSTSGCTITSLNGDSRESARILCSNGVAGTFGGTTYNQCSTGQVTIVPKFTHSASDQWGEVAAGPAFNTANPQVWDSISIHNCVGDCFWAEGSTNLYMRGMGAMPSASFTAGSMHFSNGYVVQIHNSSIVGSNLGQTVPPCIAGGCVQPSYPYVLDFDADASGLYYGSSNVAGGDFTIDDQSVIYGGVLAPLGGLPRFTNTIFEEVPGAAVTIDNRTGASTNCLVIEHSFLQDSVNDVPFYYVSYSDPENPQGCLELNNDSTVASNLLTNTYFNGQLLTKNLVGPFTSYPYDLTAPAPTYLEGGVIKSEIEGSGAGFGPSTLPFGSLPITESVASWTSACASSGPNCTITSVVGPDGPNGKMAAAEFDTTASTGTYNMIGTWTGATYPGDHFIYGLWGRPGAKRSAMYGNRADANNGFGLFSSGSDVFAGDGNAAAHVAYPTAFGPNLGYNGWAPQVAIASVVTGQSTSHNITFGVTPGIGSGTQTYGAGNGNQFAQPFWTFIPGPNNPACAAAGTCNLTIDQIEEARQDQYHGCVPPGVAAGQTATCEATNDGGITTASVTVSGAPAGSYVKADGTGYGTPSSGASGAAGGDLSGSYPNPTVAKVNGGAVPASATVMGTNSSGQPVSATTTGSGNVVLASSPTIAAPTISGTTTMQGNVTLQNGANSSQTLAMQPGTSADQIGAVQFNNYSGTAQWQLRKDTSNYLRVTDAVNSLDRSVFYQNGNTIINAGAGTNAVAINNTSGSGTGGFTVYEGGSNASTAALQVTGSGNTTATGFLQGKFMIGTGTMTLTPGAAAGTSPTIACATSHVCDGVSGTVTLTTGTSPTTGTLATLGFPNTHTNQANCIVTTESASAVITTDTWTESTTAITITANAAPAASTAYTLKYWCGGN